MIYLNLTYPIMYPPFASFVEMQEARATTIRSSRAIDRSQPNRSMRRKATARSTLRSISSVRRTMLSLPRKIQVSARMSATRRFAVFAAAVLLLVVSRCRPSAAAAAAVAGTGVDDGGGAADDDNGLFHRDNDAGASDGLQGRRRSPATATTTRTATTTTTATTTSSPVKPRKPPRVVWTIVMDDLGSKDLGLHGTGILTPNVDRMLLVNNGPPPTAAGSDDDDDKSSGTGGDGGGIYLDRYYVLPSCSPTRAALLSGRYPLRTGVHQFISEQSTMGLPAGEQTLAELLKEAGYETHAVGKWHVGHASWNQTPTFRGFDSFFGYYMGGQDYYTHKSWGNDGRGYDFRYDREPFCGANCSRVVDERGRYSTHVYTDRAIRIVKEFSDRSKKTTAEERSENSEPAPLFLYLAYQAVHSPDEVPQRYLDWYANSTQAKSWNKKRRIYAGMLSAADEGIGNVPAALKEEGLWDDTLVVFTTDNGGPTDICSAQGSSNGKRRGGKCTVWEGGTTGDGLIGGPALSKLVSASANDDDDEDVAAMSGNKINGVSESSGDNIVDYAIGRNRRVATSARTSEKKSTNTDNMLRFRGIFHVVDWLPTLAELVGVKPNGKNPLDGVSQLSGLLRAAANRDGAEADESSFARQEVFVGYAPVGTGSGTEWYGPAIRYRNWKLVQGGSGGPDRHDPHPPGGSKTPEPPGRFGYYDNSTLSSSSQQQQQQQQERYVLFDLSADEGEQVDLADRYPHIVQMLRSKLKEYGPYYVPPQANDDSSCPWTGYANDTKVGPVWYVTKCRVFCLCQDNFLNLPS